MTTRKEPAGQRRAERSAVSKKHLLEEIETLRARLADAEQTLSAISNDEVDALVVVTRSRGAEEVLTFDRAYLPYVHLVDQMRDGAVTVAEDGTVLHASRRFIELCGMRAERMIGSSFFALVAEEDEARLRDLLRRAAGAAQKEQFSLRAYSGGAPVTVEMSMTDLPATETRRTCVVVSELDAGRAYDAGALETWRAREAKLLADYQKLEAVLVELPVGIVIAAAPSGGITYANHRAEEIFGRPLVRHDSVSVRDLMCWRPDGTIAEPEELPFARVIATQRAELGTELGCQGRAGSMVFTRVSAAPLHDRSGAIAAVLLAFEDITQEQLARIEREENHRFREMFVGMFAHDLRGPLAVATMVAAAQLRRPDLDWALRRDLERIARSSSQMARMIDELLHLTRSRIGGGIPLTCRPADLAELVARAVDDFRATHAGRTIETSVTGDVRGEWDADRLSEVLFNLLKNALEHGSPDASVLLAVAERGPSVAIEVRNGGSIPEHLLPYVFDPFRRARDKSEVNADGLGLGLYIAQQIVRAHGGTISVDSSPARGTTFAVALPKAVPPIVTDTACNPGSSRSA
jgi:PAS domain S-box-containing protein